MFDTTSQDTRVEEIHSMPARFELSIENVEGPGCDVGGQSEDESWVLEQELYDPTRRRRALAAALVVTLDAAGVVSALTVGARAGNGL